MNKIFLGLITLATICWSCDKESSLTDKFTPIPTGNSNVKFLMMSPNASNVNFFVNGSKSSAVASTTSNVVQGLNFGSIYPATIGYTTIPSGSLKIEAKVTDSSSVMPGAVLSTSTHNFDPNKFYTFALVDSVSKISTVLVEDDPSVPNPTKAYLRVGNLVSNAANVTLEIIKTSPAPATSIKVFTDFSFKSFSAFEMLDAGSGEIYKISLRDATTNFELSSLTFTPTITKKYTIFARGVMGQPITSAVRVSLSSYINF